MNVTKTYAAKSSVTRALKAAGLKIEDYSIVAVEDGFQGQLTAKAPAKKEKVGGEKQPRNGACKKVWDMADSMAGAKRSEVVSACVEAGINLGTAKTQYQAWFASKRG